MLFAGGEEKVAADVLEDLPAAYGRDVTLPGTDARAALRALAGATAAEAVMDLSGEPVLDPDTRMELAAVALDLGLEYRAPGMRLTAPPAVSPDTGGVPLVAVIGTGKRTGKTALGTHLASAAARVAGPIPWSCRWGAAGRPSPVVVRAAERPGGRAAARDRARGRACGVGLPGGRGAGRGAPPSVAAAAARDRRARRSSRTCARASKSRCASSPASLVLEGSGAALPPVARPRDGVRDVGARAQARRRCPTSARCACCARTCSWCSAPPSSSRRRGAGSRRGSRAG